MADDLWNRATRKDKGAESREGYKADSDQAHAERAFKEAEGRVAAFAYQARYDAERDMVVKPYTEVEKATLDELAKQHLTSGEGRFATDRARNELTIPAMAFMILTDRIGMDDPPVIPPERIAELRTERATGAAKTK